MPKRNAIAFAAASVAIVVISLIAFFALGPFETDSITWRHGHDEQVIPVPSAAQLRYQSTDFVALIHFNMATYARDGDPGCDATNWNEKAPNATGPTSDIETFRPMSLNTTQWFDSIDALGAKIAVLTAKHGCGFLLWPTNATLPPRSEETNPIMSASSRRIGMQTTPSVFPSLPRPYGYNTNFDLLQDFVDSAKASGVGYGFYYSIMKNFFLCRSFEGINSCTETVLQNQHNITDEEYRAIVKIHLGELWTNYGDLAEVWIDSRLEGFENMLDRLQPLAGGTPSNPRQWCGTESGFPSRDVGPGPIWQTGDGFHGNASSPFWVDKFCDPQLFRDHIWFFEPNRQVRTLEEMIPIYHDIVGRGMIMELDFAINREGLVEPNHESVYRQLGEWVENCYGAPVLSKQNIIGERRISLALPDSEDISFDRIVLEEDVAVGQRIRNYTIDLVYGNSNGDETSVVTLVTNGTSIGRKRIHLLQQEELGIQSSAKAAAIHKDQNRYQTRSVVLTITEDIAPPHLSMFGLYKPCYPKSTTE